MLMCTEKPRLGTAGAKVVGGLGRSGVVGKQRGFEGRLRPR